VNVFAIAQRPKYEYFHGMKRLLSILSLMLVAYCATAQQLQTDLSLKYLVQQPSKINGDTKLIILLHGYGSNEADLFGLKDALSGNFIIVAARAPYTIQEGAYQWYTLTTANGKREGDAAQIEKSRELVSKFISELEAKYKVTPNHVYLSGFSQGAVMSYATGLTEPSKLRGIAPLSGKMPATTKGKIKVNTSVQSLRIFVSHGTADNMIAYAEGKEAVSYLQSLGLKPEFHTYEKMAHSINNSVVADLNKWLMRDK
jgi:phospholipase/carboxylesterase